MTEDNIGNTLVYTQTISGNAAKLRMYLKEVYSHGGARYILLIGNQNEIPTREYRAIDYLGMQYTPVTDKYYADFTGDYAVDGNEDWGEFKHINGGNIYGDNVDVFPEAYVGRVPCSTVTELGIWVNKLLNYETNPGNGETAYLKNFILTMADEPQELLQNDPDLNQNLSIFTTTIFKEIPDYNSSSQTIPQGPTAPYGSDIISAINSTTPFGWWTWSNHGSTNSFLTMTNGIHGTPISSINSESGNNCICSLTNSNKYGIIHSSCCQVAVFGNSTYGMAEASLFNPSGGSVAISGNTGLGWPLQEADKLIKLTSLIKGCHYGYNLFNQQIGVAEWNSYSSIHTDEYYETYLTHNYFGDPGMRYYTKAPIRLDANVAPHHIDKSQNNTITITIKNLAANDKVDVCLFKPANGTQNDYQNVQVVTGLQGNETVTFNIPANSLGTDILYVTISGFNYLPYTDEIIVSSGCGYVATPEYITTTPLPWSLIRFKDHDVIINQGVTLTIIGDVYFVPDAKLIVKPGGKLMIDSGTLGASCENLWKGVEVWGNSNLTQYSNTNQGIVQVTNNGRINDAISALSTAQPTSTGYIAGTTGGVLQCTQAKFINNRCSIHVYPYQFQNYNYRSNISNCDFILNENYLETPTGVQADSIIIFELTSLMQQANEPIKTYARNILLLNNAITYSEPYLYADELKSIMIRKKHIMSGNSSANLIQVYPNPSNNYFIVQYNLESQYKMKRLQLR